MPDNVCPHCTELADAHIATRQANERATQQEQRADGYLRKLEAMERADRLGAENTILQMQIADSNAIVAAQQGVIEDLRRMNATALRAYNEQTHAHAALRERHRIVLRAGGIMWRALKRAWQADEEQRVADAMRLVRALRDRDIEDARGKL